MLRSLSLLALTAVILIQTVPAYCGSMSLEVSAIVPPHVMAYNSLNINPSSANPAQLVQTQTVIRNNKSVDLISIVVP